jgi:hypothetical protein
MNDRNAINKKKINYSIQLLRLLLSFWVVIQHCYKKSNKNLKGLFHVPTFMIMSFFYYYNILQKRDIIKIEQRLQRISIPYILWPIFLFISNNILFILFGFSQYNKKLILKDLVLQLIFGFNYHYIFYFQFILMLLTILFTIISIIFKGSYIFIFQLFLILAYILQYSYWSLYFLKSYPDAINVSLGSIFELLPFAVSGVTLSHFDLVTMLKKFKGLTIFFSGVIIYLILKFNIFTRIEGFLFPGVMLNIGGIRIFIIFSLFSFKNKNLLEILKIITKYTGGIYYIHMISYSFLKKIFFFVEAKTFLGVIVIYIISYIICFLGNKLSYQTKFKFLFN